MQFRTLPKFRLERQLAASALLFLRAESLSPSEPQCLGDRLPRPTESFAQLRDWDACIVESHRFFDLCRSHANRSALHTIPVEPMMHGPLGSGERFGNLLRRPAVLVERDDLGVLFDRETRRCLIVSQRDTAFNPPIVENEPLRRD